MPDSPPLNAHPAPSPPLNCEHCALPIPPAALVTEVIAGTELSFCCQGCRGAYLIITGAGLERYYRQREWAEPGLPDGAFTNPYEDDFLQRFVCTVDGQEELTFVVEGLRCASCVWLNEKLLGNLDGVLSARVNYSTHRAQVRFDPARVTPARLFAAVAGLGYLPRPFTADAVHQLQERERRALLIRFGTALFLSMQLMGYSLALYAGYFQGMEASAKQLLQWFAALVSTPVVFYSGWPFLAGGWRSLRNRAPNMDLLIALGVLAAYGASLHATLLGGEVYFDTAAMIITLILAGRLFENAARRSAAAGIDRLLQLAPEMANRIDASGQCTRIESVQLKPGEQVRVLPGERFPTDGAVAVGETEVDQSAATGEALPVLRRPGESVLGGTLNLLAPVTVTVSQPAATSFVARVARLVEEAQSRRAPIQGIADRVSVVFVPVVALIAAATWLFWTMQGGGAVQPLLAAVAVVVIACPCALGLATPTAILVASGAAARRGILYRGGDILEATARLDHACFDKTGTLTSGQPRVIAIRPVTGTTDDLLQLAAGIEAESLHPLAIGICRAARERSLPVIPLPQVETFPGRGLAARSSHGMLLAGNRTLLTEHGIAVPDAAADSTTEVHLARAGEYLGCLLLEDSPRPQAGAIIAGLRRMGLRTILLTGDSPAAGATLAARLGMDEAHGGLTPEGKCAELLRLQQRGRKVLMVGDGINDAPALSTADVGCAMLGGTDIALDSSDLVLTRPDLERLHEALLLARRTLRIIRQNLFWAFVYNLAALPLAAMGKLVPVHAAAAMALSSVCVVGNSLRLGNRDTRSEVKQSTYTEKLILTPNPEPRTLDR